MDLVKTMYIICIYTYNIFVREKRESFDHVI